MKKILMIGMVAFATAAMAQGMSLADASGQLDAAVANAATMTSITRQLSAADQVTFLARVNASIDALPGSPTEKATKYLAANSAALRGAAKGNVQSLLAEVFATVPPEALTVINERFAVDLFSRTVDPAHPVSDEAFVKAAQTAMAAIQKRTASVDNAGVRDTFAILMFLRASKGAPADLSDTLVKGLADEKTQALAREEWISPALNNRDYEPMLGASDAGERPEIVQVLRLVGPQTSVAMLADLTADDTANMKHVSSMYNVNLSGIPELSDDSGLYRIPRTMNPEKRNYGGYHRGDKPNDSWTPNEPGGYSGQRIRAW